MTSQICKTIVATLLVCVAIIVLSACTSEDDISNPTASVVIPINTGDISQAVAE